MKSEKSVLHIDMDAFFASVERNRKNLDGPIVVCVYSGRSSNSGAVATCSYDARELGIHAAMPISRAKNLAEESGEKVNFVEMDREHYREVSDSIREKVFEKYSDKIEQASIDEAYLELDKSIECAREVAEKIQDDVKQDFNLSCSVGIAPNKLVAKIASDRQKPMGLTVVKEEEVEGFMEGLDLDEIHGIGAKTVKKLEELGINSVRELKESDESVLVREFGEKQGIKLKKKSQGLAETEVGEESQKQFTRITTLGENSSRASYIRKYFNELSDDIMKEVEDKDVGFRKVSLIVVDSEIEMHTRTKTLKTHVQDRDKITEVGADLLEKFLEEFDGEVRRVGLRVVDLKDFGGQKSMEEY